MNRERFITSVILILCIISVIFGILILRKEVKPAEEPAGGISGFLKTVPGKEGIAVVDIYGEISFQPITIPFGIGGRGADAIVEKIKNYSKNPKVKAIILRINSPGGTVGATQEIYEEVIKARKKGVKVVASLGDIAASGAYYIACGSDKIVANNGTITGSIGVYIGSLSLKDLMDKYGIKYNIIKSGEYKDILSMWKDLTQEEKELLQETVDNVYSQFLTAVASGRHMDLEDVKKFADGRIFSGEQGKKIKLVDELGGFEDAKLIAGKLAGLKGEPFIIKESIRPLEQLFEILSNLSIFKTSSLSVKEISPIKYRYSPQTDGLERMLSLAR